MNLENNEESMRGGIYPLFPLVFQILFLCLGECGVVYFCLFQLLGTLFHLVYLLRALLGVTPSE